jgi:ATP-binding protein involved in chromosome partitioning
MFQNVRVPVLGLVENMSYLIAPGSGERIDVFGHGGGERTANAMSVPFLGSLPLDPAVRVGGDSGRPAALDPAGKGAPFVELAERVVERLAARGAGKAPTMTVSD